MPPPGEEPPPPPPAPPRPATPRPSPGALWLLLAAAALLPLALTRLPPLHDYYHWLFIGRVFSVLCFDAPGGHELLRDYSLSPRPVPNLAAPFAIGLGSLWLPPLVCGRVFLAVLVLGFAATFAFLVRSVQGRATALELCGLPWAYGFYLYAGYLSYLAGLAFAFSSVAVLVRASRPEVATSRRRRRAGLALTVALGVLTYFAHLLAWLVVALATVVFALAPGPISRRRRAALFAALLPPLVLLARYAHGEHGIFVPYRRLADKAIVLAEALLLYVRADPFPSPLPVFAANLAGLAALAWVFIANRQRGEGRRASRPLLALAAGLGLTAIALPFSAVGNLFYPDGRFVLPALLLAAAAWPMAPLDRRRGVAATAVVVALLLVHALHFRRQGGELERLHEATRRAIPERARVLSINLRQSDLACACNPQPGFTVGEEALRWFGLVRVLESGGSRVNIMETSLVRKEFSSRTPHDLWTMSVDAAAAPALLGSTPGLSRTYPIVELLGCDEDVAVAARALSGEYREVTSGPYFALLGPAR